MSRERREYDLTCEAWREYDFGGRVYRVNNPVTLVFYYRTSPYAPLGFAQQSDTHRIVDSVGEVHCVPRPGIDGCVLRWKDKTGEPVKF